MQVQSKTPTTSVWTPVSLSAAYSIEGKGTISLSIETYLQLALKGVSATWYFSCRLLASPSDTKTSALTPLVCNYRCGLRTGSLPVKVTTIWSRSHEVATRNKMEKSRRNYVSSHDGLYRPASMLLDPREPLPLPSVPTVSWIRQHPRSGHIF